MESDSAPHVLAVIPVRGRDAVVDGGPVMLGGRPLIAYTIEAALQSPVVNRTVVTTDSPGVRDLAIELGAEAPFVRPSQLAEQDVSLDLVLQNCLAWLVQHEGLQPDLVVSMETPHPIRPPELLEQVITVLEEQQLDTVVTVYEELRPIWRVDEYGQLDCIGGEEAAPKTSRRPLYRQLAGLALACRGSLLLREGKRFGNRVGIVPLREPWALVDTQDPYGMALAEYMLENPAAVKHLV